MKAYTFMDTKTEETVDVYVIKKVDLMVATEIAVKMLGHDVPLTRRKPFNADFIEDTLSHLPMELS